MAEHDPLLAVLFSAFCCMGLAPGANGTSRYELLDAFAPLRRKP